MKYKSLAVFALAALTSGICSAQMSEDFKVTPTISRVNNIRR